MKNIFRCSLKGIKKEKANSKNEKPIEKNDFPSIEKFFNEIKSRLTISESEFLEKSTNTNIENFESKYDVILSEELKSYFKIIGGIYGYDFISTLNNLKTLKLVKEYDWYSEKNEYLDNKYDKMFVLGDIMINSHQWVIILNGNGETERIIEMDFENEVAPSISEFLSKFLIDPYSLVA